MNLISVTTTSPIIGHFVRENFSELEVRASVNMEIATEEGMEYLADSFTSYYAKRELNHDLTALRRLRNWCDDHGKRLNLLANSGCLNYCSARQFHDNLVAHEQEIAIQDNAFVFHSACRSYLGSEKHRANILRVSNWIRPEDMEQYEEIADGVKLATRVAANPLQILLAYTSGHFAGNMLELLEPNYSELFYPVVLDNTAFPDDYNEKRCQCNRDCKSCGYCEQVFHSVKRTIPNMMVDNNDMDNQEDTITC